MTCGRQTTLARRGFIRLAALGAGAALYGVSFPVPTRAAGKVEAVLLTCMDYRLMDEIVSYMDGRGLNGDYDHLILAGASLGALVEEYPAWGETFWSHVGVAIELHGVRRLMVMDHRDCGAYKIFLGEEAVATPAKESAAHAERLTALRAAAAERFPQLETELLLMSLDGSVEVVG